MGSTLTIGCAGICTHFVDVVPGVRHRVVLPNATALRVGHLRLEIEDVVPRRDDYFAFPHQPYLLVLQGTFVGEALLPERYLQLDRIHLRVLNPVLRPVQWLPSFRENTRSLTEYVPSYVPSSEVVLGGRAASYFDVTHGAQISTPPPSANGAANAQIVIETEGPPLLEVTPFPNSLAKAIVLKLASDPPPILMLANLEVDSSAASGVSYYDYLLHYLTEASGIPSVVVKAPPGMTRTPPSQTPENLAAALNGLASFLDQPPSYEQLREALQKIQTDAGPACSDSRYP